MHTRPQAIPTFIVGDINARLHGSTCEAEDEIMGRHVFGYGPQHVRTLVESQRDNRQCLVDFCIANQFVVSNTLFAKPEWKTCTYKDVATNGFTGPWTPDRFAQLDLILAPKAYKNCVKDVEARTDIAINSDHAMVTASIQVKLKANSPSKIKTVQRYHTPTDQEKQKYNDHIRNIFNPEHIGQGQNHNCSKFVFSMKVAASNFFKKKDKKAVKPYISAETWQLLEDRQLARNHGRTEKEKTINREIVKQARCGKRKWTLERLQDLTDVKTSWRNVKFEKKAFTPNFYTMKDIHGNQVPIDKKAHALAQYLYNKQWKPIPNPRPVEVQRRQIIHSNLNMTTTDFSPEEVSAAIRSLKTNKAPGLDGATTELFKYLDAKMLRASQIV